LVSQILALLKKAIGISNTNNKLIVSGTLKNHKMVRIMVSGPSLDAKEAVELHFSPIPVWSKIPEFCFKI
jgi:hypothetical protein